MYLLKVFNGTQHFLNLCTVLFLNVVIIWYIKKSGLPKKMLTFQQNSKNSKFQEKTLRLWEVFCWNWSLHPCGFHLMDSTLGGAVTFNSWWTMWRLHISTAFRWIGEAFRKPVMLGSCWRAENDFSQRRRCFFFFFSEGQVFRSDGSDTRFGPYLLKVRYPGKFLLNRHGFMCVYGSKIGSMPPKKTFFLNRSYFTNRHRNQ